MCSPIKEMHHMRNEALHVINSCPSYVAPSQAMGDLYTVFIRIVAAATINFSLAGVRLLIEGGSYSRTAFIYFGGIPLRRPGGILL